MEYIYIYIDIYIYIYIYSTYFYIRNITNIYIARYMYGYVCIYM